MTADLRPKVRSETSCNSVTRSSRQDAGVLMMQCSLLMSESRHASSMSLRECTLLRIWWSAITAICLSVTNPLGCAAS